MDLLSCLGSLRSVRTFQSDTPVPDITLRAILEAGRLAPSADNLQPWRFMLVTSQAWLDRIHAAFPHSWFMDAPHVLVVKGCSQKGWIRPADQRSFIETDLAIALSYMTIAAWSLGVGSCWVSNFEPEILHRNLGLGQEEAVFAITPLGFPAGPSSAQLPERQRKSFDDVAILL